MMDKRARVSTLCERLMQKTIRFLFATLDSEAHFNEHKVDLWKTLRGHPKFAQYRGIFDRFRKTLNFREELTKESNVFVKHDELPTGSKPNPRPRAIINPSGVIKLA